MQPYNSDTGHSIEELVASCLLAFFSGPITNERFEVLNMAHLGSKH
jgi:hypothetical protein